MGNHLINGEFQSDKYPTTPRGKVPLSVKDKDAQDLLWLYAQRHRTKDPEFSEDLETALTNAGYAPAPPEFEVPEAQVLPAPKPCGHTVVRLKKTTAFPGVRWACVICTDHKACNADCPVNAPGNAIYRQSGFDCTCPREP